MVLWYQLMAEESIKASLFPVECQKPPTELQLESLSDIIRRDLKNLNNVIIQAFNLL